MCNDGWQWAVFGGVQLVVGVVLHFTIIPMNTDLYSISYTLVTGAAASLTLAGVSAVLVVSAYFVACQ